MSSSSPYHPSSVWATDMHAVPVTKEQASLMIGYLVRQRRIHNRLEKIYLKHIPTNTIHFLRIVGHPNPLIEFAYITERYSNGNCRTWCCFAGRLIPRTKRSDMVDFLSEEYATPWKFKEGAKGDIRLLGNKTAISKLQFHFSQKFLTK